MNFVRPVLPLVFSPKLQERGGGGTMILIDVETIPAGIKPPAADNSMCIFTGEKWDFGVSVHLFTTASPMHFSGAKRGSAIMPKLGKHVGPSMTLAEELSQCVARSVAAPFARLRVFVSVSTGSAIMLKLVKYVGPSLTLAEELSPCFARSVAAPYVRLRVFVSVSTSSSVARRGC